MSGKALYFCIAHSQAVVSDTDDLVGKRERSPMVDTDLFPLFFRLFGEVGGSLLKTAAKSHVEKYFGKALERIASLHQKSEIEAAVENASALWVEATLKYLEGLGCSAEELSEYKASFETLLGDQAVGVELVRPVAEPEAWQEQGVDAQVFQEAWCRLSSVPLPSEFLWSAALRAYQKHVQRQRMQIPDLRSGLNAENLQVLRDELIRQGGVRPLGNERRYADRMRSKYRVLLELPHLAPATTETGESPKVQEVFIPQDVRENPPQIELPRDLIRRIMEASDAQDQTEHREPMDQSTQELLEQIRSGYAAQSREPVLEVLGRPQSRAAVLLGDPGSGKSTLARYLLLSILNPPLDLATGKAMTWVRGFQNHLPLLIELREFIAQRIQGNYNNFVEFLHFLGRTQAYHLEDRWLTTQLRDRPCLVIFDGLDEIFDPAEQEQIAHQIAGFAHEYPAARIVVTSRPVGYRWEILKAEGFHHFALQDLSDEQIASFVQRWFRRVFPNRPAEAESRVGRLLEAITQSRSIRLLAGNPMLLTVMALMARQRELPRERYRFYDFSAEVLCYHWDMNRHLRAAGFADYIDVDDKKELLRRIAYRMLSGQEGLAGNFIHADDLRQEFETYLATRYKKPPAEAKSLAKALIEQLRSRNYVLCLHGTDHYGFVHRTFLEYFCATELVRRLHENPEEYPIDRLLRETYAVHWSDPTWHELLMLICAGVGEGYAAKIIDYLIDSANPDWQQHLAERPPAHLLLAVRCLAEVRNRPAIEATCRRLLVAICAMFELSLLPSWHLKNITDDLAEAVDDVGPAWPGSEWLQEDFSERLLTRTNELLSVAFVSIGLSLFGHDSALGSQLAGLVSDDLVLQEGRAKEVPDHVRGAILRVLAREVGREASIRTLLERNAGEGRSADVRSIALTALAREWSDDPAVRMLVERLLSDDRRNPKVRRAAVQAIASAWPADPAAIELLRSAVRDEHPQVRRAALQALSLHGQPDLSIRQLMEERFRQDDDPYVKVAALDELARRWREAPSIRLLVRQAAVANSDPFLRGASLEILLKRWPHDPESRELLRQSARHDDDPYVRKKAFGNLVRSQLDKSAALLLSQEYDGFDPFIDPRLGLPSLEDAAERLLIPMSDLQQRVTDYSRVLGWDLLAGLNKTEVDPGRGKEPVKCLPVGKESN